MGAPPVYRVVRLMLNYKTHGNYRRLWRIYGRSVFRYATPKKLWNALRTEMAYRQRTIDVCTAPYVLFLEPLYHCNLRCPLCPREIFPGARKNDVRRLSLELFDRVLDELGDYLFQCHIFGLGEPLVDWELTRQVIERAHRRRIFTLISTNCTLVTPRVAAEIVGSGLDYLVCAIDGTSQESYGRYRVGGSFHQALAGLELLVKEQRRQQSRMNLEWQFLVHSFNRNEVQEARRIANRLKIHLRFVPIGGTENDPAQQDYWLGGASGREKPAKPGSKWHCYWLWRGLSINSNGQLARCPGYSNVAQLGSLHSASVMSLYNGAVSQRARQLFSCSRVPEGEFPAPCNNCSFFARKRGGPSQTTLQNGSLISPESLLQPHS